MYYDLDFLTKLDKQKNKVIYARITALSIQEEPLQRIEGHVQSGGSLNLDGTSTVRRTCSLSLVAQNYQFNDFYWGLNTKFKLEIGLNNSVDDGYPEICWFNQGIFVITSFSASRSTNNLTLSITGTDKMALLNGTISGQLPTSVDFGTIEEETEVDGILTMVKRNLSIEEIITNMLHQWAGEPYHNIILRDLDVAGFELLEYRGEQPLYLLRQGTETSDKFLNITYQGDTECWLQTTTGWVRTTLKGIADFGEYYSYDQISSPLLIEDKTIALVKMAEDDSEVYTVVRLQYGNTIGYRTTELTYAGELIAKAGETLTSVLDKIKNMLGDYEYFYDTDGRFVLQRKPSVLKRSWIDSYLSIKKEEEINELYLEALSRTSEQLYQFNDSELIISFNNTPALNNVKNDYAIWGQRKSIAGNSTIPILLRYAIDKKPTNYTSIVVKKDNEELQAYEKKYDITANTQVIPTTYLVGDSYSNTIVEDPDGQALVIEITSENEEYFEHYDKRKEVYFNEPINPDTISNIEIYSQKSGHVLCDLKWSPNLQYPEGLDKELDKKNKNKVHYYLSQTERRYTRTIVCDWRELIYHMALDYQQYNWLSDFQLQLAEKNNANYPTGVTGYERYYVDLLGFWRDIYNPFPDEDEAENFYSLDYGDTAYSGWNKNIVESPETLNFWFDFIDTNGSLDNYNVSTIGHRPYVLNDNNVKAISFLETPTIVYVNDLRNYLVQPSGDYSYIQLPKDLELASVSAQGISALDKFNDLLYQYSYATESCSITAIPIYHLQPNTRVQINDNSLGIHGDYIITKITLPLGHTGNMSITATKAVENII